MSFNSLFVTIVLIITYVIFTLNYPEYEIDMNYNNCKNDLIKYISIINNIIFVVGCIYLLLFVNPAFEQFKTRVYIPYSCLQITFLCTAIILLNNAKCANYMQLINYYSFIDAIFWVSAYWIYIKLGITQLFL